VPEYLAPGVLVEEVSFRVRTIRAADTSVAALVGPTHARTPPDPRQLLTSLGDLEAVHGDGAALDLGRGRRPPHQVWHAARAFFDNGGRQLHVGSIAAGALPAAADYEAALRRLESVQGVSIVAAPGLAARATQVSDPDTEARSRAVLRHLDATRYRFAILDPPDGQTPAEVRSLRARLRSSNAALYYPWVTASDPRTGSTMGLPPGGFLAGVYARVDRERGVHQAPADEEVRLATGLERALTHGEMEGLNQEGVSCLRLLRGRVVVWGARTLAGDPEWRYVNVRRLFLFLERSIDDGTQWAVFEPNGERLWQAVREAVTGFLTAVWRDGALQGRRAEEAFFVRCDRSTMTQNDLDNGRLVCEIGVAPMRPAEFVIFRIGQKTLDAR
jgi:phage tail sheath protein FI